MREFLRTLIDVFLSSSFILTEKYLDGRAVFDPQCEQQSSVKVPGARNLCGTAILHKQLCRLSSKDGKPWFEFYRCLCADITKLSLNLRELIKIIQKLETKVIRAIIAVLAIQKHWQTLGIKSLLLRRWKNFVALKKVRKTEGISSFLRQCYVNSKNNAWGHDPLQFPKGKIEIEWNETGEVDEEMDKEMDKVTDKVMDKVMGKVMDKVVGKSKKEDMEVTTEVMEVTAEDTKNKGDDKMLSEQTEETKNKKMTICLEARDPSLNDVESLFLRQHMFYWHHWTVLSAKLRFDVLLLDSADKERFLKWDCSRIKKFTLKLAAQIREMREHLLKLPHELAVKRTAFAHLQAAAKDTGSQDEQILLELNHYECLVALFEFAKRIGPTEQELHVTLVMKMLKQIFSRGSLKLHSYHKTTGDRAQDKETYLTQWYPIQRRILSYLDPSLKISSPLHVLQRSVDGRSSWCDGRWEGVSNATIGWGWVSNVNDMIEQHVACFEMVGSEIFWGSPAAKEVAFERFRSRNMALIKKIHTFLEVNEKKVEEGEDVNCPLRKRVEEHHRHGHSRHGHGRHGGHHRHGGHGAAAAPAAVDTAVPAAAPGSPSKRTTSKGKHSKKHHHSNRKFNKHKTKQKPKMYAEWNVIAKRARHPVKIKVEEHHQSDNTSTDNKARSAALQHDNILRSLAEQHEFVLLNKKTMEQILKLDTNDEGVTTNESLEESIREACPVVRRVYGYYKSGRSMNKGDYIQFIQQSKVVSRRNEIGLQSADVELLWLKCSQQAAAVKAGKSPALLPFQFMECCLRIAAIKYESLSPSVLTRIERLCTDDLRWNSRWADVDAFRKKLVEEQVMIVYDRHVNVVREIFQTWSRKNKMSLKQWKTMVGVLLLEETSARLNSRHVESIFHKSQSGSLTTQQTTVQSGEGEEDESCGGGAAAAATTLTEEQVAYESSVLDFTEFWECLGNIATFENPDPYVPVGIKMTTFFESNLVPRFEHYQDGGEFGVKNFLKVK